MKGRITGMADVNHRGRIEFDQLFVDRIPIGIRERRIGPVATGWIRVEVHSDKSMVSNASLEFGDAVLGGYARALRQHSRADKIPGKQLADPMDEFVAGRGPG